MAPPIEQKTPSSFQVPVNPRNEEKQPNPPTSILPQQVLINSHLPQGSENLAPNVIVVIPPSESNEIVFPSGNNPTQARSLEGRVQPHPPAHPRNRVPVGRGRPPRIQREDDRKS